MFLYLILPICHVIYHVPVFYSSNLSLLYHVPISHYSNLLCDLPCSCISLPQFVMCFTMFLYLITQICHVFYHVPISHSSNISSLLSLILHVLPCLLTSVHCFTGVFYAMAIIGPALGYLMGGEFLKRYTDIGSVDITR